MQADTMRGSAAIASERGRMKWWRWVLGSVLGILLLAAGVFVVWASMAAQPMPEALAALQSDSKVIVTTQDSLVFRPAGAVPDTGLVFYPGARVDPRAYAPAAHEIASGGYLVVIVPMPLNLAVFGSGKASGVIAAYPEIKHWALGGHSLGGAMAAHFAHDHPGEVQGLSLWASYPAEGDNLASGSLAVTSIYGTRDGLATHQKVDASRKLLPTGTRYVPIEGGNHAQFGWYGPQDGDNAATTSREDQQKQVTSATEQLLQSLANR